MSNKMLLSLFVVGAVVVGGVALRNKTMEVVPVVDDAVEMVESYTGEAVEMVESATAPEEIFEEVSSEEEIEEVAK